MSGTQSFVVHPAEKPLSGDIRVPGDKSIGHRAVLLAALSSGTSRVSGLSGGQDNQRTVAALAALGVPVLAEGPGALTVQGRGLHGLSQAAADLDCGNSGTSIRLLTGVLAAQRFPSRLLGDRYLNARPMRRVVDPIRQMGGVLSGSTGKKPDEVYPPLSIEPAPSLHGITYRSAIASAQVKSAILLCGLWAEGPTTVIEPVRSRDHTERLLRALGVPIQTEDQEDGAARSSVNPAGWQRQIPAFSLEVPGDLSSAAFLLGAALLVPGSHVVVRNVGLNPTRTGFLDIIEQMCPGAIRVEQARTAAGEPIGDLVVQGSTGDLRGVRIGGSLAVRAIDELPLLLALSAVAQGETVLSGAHELRVKESDRIAATCALLHAFGVSCEERPDGMVVAGRGPLGLLAARVDSQGDHRIAMAASVLSLLAPGDSRIDDIDNVATSFPTFVQALRQVGVGIQVRPAD